MSPRRVIAPRIIRHAYSAAYARSNSLFGSSIPIIAFATLLLVEFVRRHVRRVQIRQNAQDSAEPLQKVFLRV